MDAFTSIVSAISPTAPFAKRRRRRCSTRKRRARRRRRNLAKPRRSREKRNQKKRSRKRRSRKKNRNRRKPPLFPGVRDEASHFALPLVLSPFLPKPSLLHES